MQWYQRQNVWLFIISFVAVCIALFLFNPFDLYFLNDDFIHIPLSREGKLFQRNSFRPICDLSVQFDYFLWGKRAYGYHLTNVAIHSVNTVLVFFLSSALNTKYGSATGSPKVRSLMTAVLFFVYAFHSESIFWILGRSASLGVLFFIPALLFYFKRNSLLCFTLSMLFFCLSLLTYESVWIFPLIVVMLSIVDVKYNGAKASREAVYSIIPIALFIVYLLLRYYTIAEIAGGYEASNFTSFNLSKLSLNAVRLIVRCFTPPVENSWVFLIGASVCAAILLAAIGLKIRSASHRLLPSILLAMLLVAFVPYLSLGLDIHTVEGERFLYLPSVFASLLLVVLLPSFANRNIVPAVFSVLLCYQLYWLASAKSNYKKASAITKSTFNQINGLSNKRRLFIDSLPANVNGALVFRLGFEEGIQWLKEEGKVDTVIVLSTKKNNNNWASEYAVKNSTAPSAKVIDKRLLRDSTHQTFYLETQIPSTIFNAETDAWFIFNDEYLQVIK